ncbi:MAG: ABC transporter ATP-binding protein [Candidatus Omnitrophica bacterium]|nr:ABC transporter ATP-binding protein [Candidatus Omnitrophota bacterium]
MTKMGIRDSFCLLKDIYKITRPNVLFLLLSALFIFIATFAQFAGLGLLIPVLNSMIDKAHFLGMLNMPVLGKLIKILPFADSNASIFLYMTALIMIAVYVENFALFASKTLVSKVTTESEHTVRTRIFKRYLGFAKAFYDRENIGELNSYLISWTSTCTKSMLQLNTMAITAAFAFSFLIFMFTISWRLTLGVGIILWVGQKSTRWVVKKVSQSSKQDFKERVKLASNSLDVLFNIPLVKLHANEDREFKKFDDTSKEAKRHSFNIRKKQESIPLIVDTVNSTGLIIIVCISVFLYFYRNDYSLGRFLIFFVVLRRFVLHVSQLNYLSITLTELIAPARKILWIFDDFDKSYIKSGLTPYSSLKREIAFKDVNFSYIKNIPVLKDISFRVKKGEMLAIVGPSGSGKTTIANLLSRLYEYDSGSIEIDGTNIRDFELNSLHKKIGVVGQDAMLFNDTIKNNIVYGLDESEVDVEKLDMVLKDSYIYDFVMSLSNKYDTIIGDRGVRLSGGEKQRVSIARVLLKDPDILILDEATSALDTTAEAVIQKAIESLVKNRTVFVIAHRFSTIKNADKIIVVEKGEIKEQGGLQELLEKKGKFYYYWEQQKLFY